MSAGEKVSASVIADEKVAAMSAATNEKAAAVSAATEGTQVTVARVD